MRKVLSFLVLTLSAFSIANASSWQEYYELKNKAELEICKSNYKQALSLYKKAFQIKDAIPWDYDIVNAFNLAMETGDQIYAREQLLKLIDRRYSPKSLNKLLNSYQQNEWRFINEILVANPVDTVSYNPICAEIEKLFLKEDDYKHYLNSRNKGGFGDDLDKVDSLDIETAYALRKLLKNGLLSESEIRNYDGVVDVNGMVLTMIYNYNKGVRQRKQVAPIFDTLLAEGLTRFSISPANFVQNTGESKSFEIENKRVELPLSFFVAEYLERWYLPKINKEKLNNVNEMRRAVGLCSIEDLLTKIEYQNRHMKNGNYEGKYEVSVDVLGVLGTDEYAQLKNWQETAEFPEVARK